MSEIRIINKFFIPEVYTLRYNYDKMNIIKDGEKMFDFLKRKKKDKQPTETQATPQEIYAAADGEFLSIEAINDPVFSQKMMGDGFGVEPDNGNVYAPIAGTIMSIFPTKHAVYIKTDSDLEILVHMGIDTVELEGEPFNITVSENQKVAKGDKIAEINLDALKEAEKEKTVVVIFTNMNEVNDLTFAVEGKVTAGDIVGHVTANK